LIKLIDTNALIEFYKQGYFPMADSEESETINFYKPKLRFIIPIRRFHCPKKLFIDFKKSNYVYKINSEFSNVMHLCKTIKRREKNTWINKTIINTYKELHNIGKCHSLECYEKNNLIGGLYGVHLGSCFFGESMFSVKKNASKYCLLYLIAILKKNNFSLLDSQFFNPHLVQFGAYEIENDVYQDKLNNGLKNDSNFEIIESFHEVLSLIQSTSQRS